MSEPYKNREIDQFHSGLKEQIGSLRDDMNKGFGKINARLDVTNGKVKKIIIALVAVGFFALGLGLKEARFLIGLIL